MKLYLTYYKRVMHVLGQICKIKQTSSWEKTIYDEVEINIEDDENDHSWGFVNWILTNTFQLYSGTTKYNIKYLFTFISEYNKIQATSETNLNTFQLDYKVKNKLLSNIFIIAIEPIWLILNNLVLNV